MASQCNSTNLIYNGILGGILPDSVRNVASLVPGITDFIITRAPSGGIPAYDLAYHFLISRDDIRITASPSLLTMNETEASIEFEEEISVSVGTFVIPNAGTATLQETFARATYGISIDVIPTVHMHDPDSPCDDGIDYITLDSNVKFETFLSSVNNNRPNVLRRRLQNQARIADGQTVIIGGFRRKDVHDTTTKIPFLGEIPGFGLLFSNTQMSDASIETFLFLTAKIVTEPSEDLETIKMEEMARRPGDLPYFMKALRDARETEQNRFLASTIQLLFGREQERFVDKEACPYDGR
jgi:general secretion pathway protein D